MLKTIYRTFFAVPAIPPFRFDAAGRIVEGEFSERTRDKEVQGVARDAVNRKSPLMGSEICCSYLVG
jgi:hypothetical protein